MRNEINQKLKNFLKNHPQALSAWLGGSSATGKEDHLSDTDLVVVAKDPNLVFDSIENFLNQNYGIEQLWDVKDSVKYLQKFYILKNSPETYYLDLVVFKEGDPEVFQEYFNINRHGSPVILFDKPNILSIAAKTPRLESPSIDLDNTKAMFEILFRATQKEILRLKYIDAYAFYLKLVGLYVKTERIKHCPQKHDFGFRYLYQDLPKEITSFCEDLLKVNDLETIQKKSNLLRERIINL